MIHEEEVQAIEQKVADRRTFLKSAGFTGLGLASAGLIAGKMGVLDQTPIGKALGIKTPEVLAATGADLDTALLNFALNLEYLQAEFYTVATSGKYIADFGIATDGVGTYGPTTGGNQINFHVNGPDAETSQLTNLSLELASNEREHVKLLRSLLGSAAIAKPALNLTAFPVGFGNVGQYLTIARILEEQQASGYSGILPLLTNKSYLAYASQIALAEANHDGTLRYLTALYGVPMFPMDAADIIPPPRGVQYFCTTSNEALYVNRTTDQVLAVLYDQQKVGTNKGAFFPNGLNGSINTVMS